MIENAKIPSEVAYIKYDSAILSEEFKIYLVM